VRQGIDESVWVRYRHDLFQLEETVVNFSCLATDWFYFPINHIYIPKVETKGYNPNLEVVLIWAVGCQPAFAGHKNARYERKTRK
jgi:hypothetical protein